MRVIVCLIILLPISAVFACGQDTTKTNKNIYSLLIGASYNFNKLNIKQDIDGPLTAKNTIAYQVSFQYDRVIKNHFLAGLGLDIGNQKHIISVIQHLDNFDPDAAVQLKDQKYEHDFVFNNSYVAPKLTIGYMVAISKKINLIGKFGLREVLFLNGGRGQSNYATLQYPLDNDPKIIRQADFNSFSYFFGEERSENRFHKLFPWNNSIENWEIYLGLERKVNNFFVRSLNVGFSIKRTLFNAMYPSLSDYYISHWGESSFKEAGYYQNNFAVGLYLGINL